MGPWDLISARGRKTRSEWIAVWVAIGLSGVTATIHLAVIAVWEAILPGSIGLFLVSHGLPGSDGQVWPE